MRSGNAIVVCALISLITLTCCVPILARNRKLNRRYLKVIEAYTEDIRSGRQGGGTSTNHYFILEWRSATPPDSFFWRGDSGWAKCRIDKVHKIAGKPEYMKERTKTMRIGKGDTLMLTASQGVFPVPPSIGEKIKNKLFFTAGSNKWLSVPVAKFSDKGSRALP